MRPLPRSNDWFLHRHDAIEVGNEPSNCKKWQEGIGGAPSALDFMQLVLVNLHEWTYFDEGPLLTGPHDIACLREDDEPDDLLLR